jgi:hypothetical protein
MTLSLANVALVLDNRPLEWAGAIATGGLVGLWLLVAVRTVSR